MHPALVLCVKLHTLSEATLPSPLWHTAILFGDEVKYIWMHQWSLFSLFWFLVRQLRD